MTHTYKCKNPFCSNSGKLYDIWVSSYSSPIDIRCPICKTFRVKRMTLGPKIKDGSFNLSIGMHK